jgi:predicted PurR-regulated permease PerM
MNLNPAQKQSLSWLGIALAFALAVWLLGPVLTPFVVAAVLAYALHPFVERLVARKIPRLVAITLVEVLLIVTILAVLLLIVPILSKEIPLLREQIPVLAERINAWLSPLLAQFGVPFTLDVASLKAFVLKYLNANVEDGLTALLASVRIGGSAALALVGNAVLIPVVLFYLLMDWAQVVQRVQDLIPPRLRLRVNSFLDESDAVLGQYLRGQLLVMLILALYYTVALLLFGLDLALPIGVFTGLAIFVPYLGFGLGLLLALLAGLLEFASIKALVMVAVVYGFGQVVESLYLTPRLLGERIGLHPLAVIFALLAFGQVFGFVGVLIALPASAVLLVAIRRLKAAYLSSKLYKG